MVLKGSLLFLYCPFRALWFSFHNFNQQTYKKDAYNCFVIHNNINFKLLHVLDLAGPSLGSTLIVAV
jgi:hypothetical protein